MKTYTDFELIDALDAIVDGAGGDFSELLDGAGSDKEFAKKEGQMFLRKFAAFKNATVVEVKFHDEELEDGSVMSWVIENE